MTNENMSDVEITEWFEKQETVERQPFYGGCDYYGADGSVLRKVYGTNFFEDRDPEQTAYIV